MGTSICFNTKVIRSDCRETFLGKSRYSNSGKWRSKNPKSRRTSQKIIKNTPDLEVEIAHLSSKGDGVGYVTDIKNDANQRQEIYTANTLPGESVRVRLKTKIGKGYDAELLELISSSEQRQSPLCASFTRCGGCQLQHLNYDAYLNWKQKNILNIFEKSNIELHDFRGFKTSKNQKKRRASFKFKRTVEKSYIGFYERQSHQIIELDGCVVLSSELLVTKELISAGLSRIIPVGIPITVQINQYETGCDILLISEEKLNQETEVALTSWAADTHFQRVSYICNNEIAATPLYQGRKPTITWDDIIISPPPGCFLQPTLFGEKELQTSIISAYKDAKNCLDLFSGCGTLSAKLLSKKVRVTAIDSQEDSLSAYQEGYQNSFQDSLLSVETRNLIEAPVMSDYLNKFDAIMLDPPRNGAFTQINQIALSDCPNVTYVSCNPYSFAKDAAVLIKAGYKLANLTLLDQFIWTAHCELIANFQKG